MELIKVPEKKLTAHSFSSLSRGWNCRQCSPLKNIGLRVHEIFDAIFLVVEVSMRSDPLECFFVSAPCMIFLRNNVVVHWFY